jgi:flagellar basal-body rod protein FlgB
MELITSFPMELVSKALDGHSKRHAAISSNLANVDTPRYKRKDTPFEGTLKSMLESHAEKKSPQQSLASNNHPLAMTATLPGHYGNQAFLSAEISNSPEIPPIEETGNYQFRNDENSVDVESEMVQLARNTERYSALSKMESNLFSGIRSVIRDAGGG